MARRITRRVSRSRSYSAPRRPSRSRTSYAAPRRAPARARSGGASTIRIVLEQPRPAAVHPGTVHPVITAPARSKF